MENAPVKWGIVSTADINRKVIPGAKESPHVDLVAVASRDAARAQAYAHEWEIPRAYGSYEELYADPDVEAVYISLPNTMHVEWSIKALEALKLLTGAVEPALDRIVQIDARNLEQTVVKTGRRPDCASCARVPAATQSG